MSKIQELTDIIVQGYLCSGSAIELGCAKFEGQVLSDAIVQLPLSMLTRHGLIAGATGTGKTKSIQLLAEKLSENGVPSMVMDLKGDLSGLAQAGQANKKIDERYTLLNSSFDPQGYPLELLSLSKQPGAILRATVTEYGPILFSKILELNDTQSSILSVIFQFCDEQQLAVVDLKDLKSVLNYVTKEGKQEFSKAYGDISTRSVGTILRKIVQLESQGAKQFFGEPSFDVADLLNCDSNGMGIISTLRLSDIQNKPLMFSSFMLCLLAEIYETFPEQGDANKPKLVLFIDEAHLLFEHASSALLKQIETIVKLIRSKGVGIIFCTQNPKDIPDAILAQLGLKIQHALRAFTAKDRKAIKLAAENFPLSDFYSTSTLLTSMGIGEAAITVLNEKGLPTPLAHTLLFAPRSRMGILTNQEIDTLTQSSTLVEKYNTSLDRQSAYEILSDKLEQTDNKKTKKTSTKSSTKKQQSLIDNLSKNTMVRQMGREMVREVTRGLLGVLGLGKRR